MLVEMRHLWPSAQLTVLAFDIQRPEDSRAWFRQLGVEIVVPPVDLRAWLDSHSYQYSLVVLSGPIAYRLAATIRANQPQAVLAVDIPGDVVGARDRFHTALFVPEERLGERLVGGVEQKWLDQAATLSDAALVEASPLGARLPGRTKLFEFDGVLDPRPLGGPGERTGAVVAARFGEEFGEPDEAGIEQLLAFSSGDGQALLERMRLCLRRPPPSLRRRAAKAASLATEALQFEVASARAMVTVRPFGSPPLWLQRLAVETGTPWVLLGASPVPGAINVEDVSELRRVLGTLLDDDEAWCAAQARLLEAASPKSARDCREGLVALLGSVGFMPPTDEMLDAPPAALRQPVHFSGFVDQGGVLHGQVRSAGWQEHRPMNPVMRRAEVSSDALLPHIAYHWWYEAHPLLPETAETLREVGAAVRSQPLISIVMPVYNTDPQVLDETLSSVRRQLYRNWELCIADDASTSSATVEVLERHAREDIRIRVHRLLANSGIAAASNAAAALATGEYVALLDHDDLLTPDALVEVVELIERHPELDFVYTDEDKLDEHGNHVVPFFKPSWSPELHLCVNYVTHFAVYRKTLFDRLGGFRPGFDGSQDYDLSLRFTEVTHRVGHVAKPVYTWRMVPGSAATAHDAKPYALDAAKRALSDAVSRRWPAGRIEEGIEPGTWRPRYPIVGKPLVSVLIPTRNGREMLERCIDGVLHETSYRHVEIVVVDNASDEEATLDYLALLDATVVRYPYRFNYARQMNLAAAAATGDLLLMLNNDIEIIDPGWLESMVELAQRPEVGAVGARLVFPSGRPQHEGVFVGFGGGCAGNIDFGGYFGLGRMIRDCTAVTAACMLIRPAVLAGVGGFDERLRVAFNDVDLCLRLRQRGYRILYTPYAELIHAESASRGSLHPLEDEAFFIRRWGGPDEFEDPFYNPNFDPARPFRLIR